MPTATPIEYDHDGTGLVGRLAAPSASADTTGRRPGVVLYPEGSGLTSHTTERAERLADAGYLALAADMYGTGGTLADSRPVEEAQQLMQPLLADPMLLRSRGTAAAEAVRADPRCDGRIAVAGFCFGGMVALELARSGLDAAVAASFHGVLSTAIPARPDAMRAHVAVFTGDRDIYADEAARRTIEQELDDAGASWQMTVFGGVKHSFTNPAVDALGLDDFRYDPRATEQAWRSFLVLLDQHLREPG